MDNGVLPGTGTPTDSVTPWPPLADPLLADDAACPACGHLAPGISAQPRGPIVLRARLPQPIAAALLRTRTLSPREMAVFELLGLGYDNRSVARMLRVSERTAKRHVTAILAKLGLESRLQAGLTALLTLSLTPSLAQHDQGWPEGRMDRLANPE